MSRLDEFNKLGDAQKEFWLELLELMPGSKDRRWLFGSVESTPHRKLLERACNEENVEKARFALSIGGWADYHLLMGAIRTGKKFELTRLLLDYACSDRVPINNTYFLLQLHSALTGHNYIGPDPIADDAGKLEERQKIHTYAMRQPRIYGMAVAECQRWEKHRQEEGFFPGRHTEKNLERIKLFKAEYERLVLGVSVEPVVQT